jgi:shikimate dehydrogenase
VISAGVLGSPISHSLSPVLHRAAYAALGVTAQYNAYEVGSGDLRKFLINDGKDLNCLSLTMPLKEEAVEIADHVSEMARQIASGNTLHKMEDGWHLTSTDVEGFTYALSAHQESVSGRVAVIGAGATARAVVAACNFHCKNLIVIGRSESRKESISKAAPDQTIEFVDWGSELSLDSFDLVVNTTPGDSAAKFLPNVVSPKGTFFEVIYNPWPTQLLARWNQAGGSTIDGLELLIHQAISQIEIFSGRTVNRTELAALMRTEGMKALK